MQPPKNIDIDAALEAIAGGESANAVGLRMGYSAGKLLRRLRSNPELQDAYDAAVKARTYLHAEQIVEIADEDCSAPVFNDEGEEVGRAVDKAKVAHQTLRVHTRQWAAARLLGLYKEKSELEHKGTVVIQAGKHDEAL